MATTIGIALAKLELLEKQGCKVETQAEREDQNDDASNKSDIELIEECKKLIALLDNSNELSKE